MGLAIEDHLTETQFFNRRSAATLPLASVLVQDFPGSPVVKTLCCFAGMLVQFLLKELGSHKLCSQKKSCQCYCFPALFALFGSLCHILIVLEIFLTFSFVVLSG